MLFSLSLLGTKRREKLTATQKGSQFKRTPSPTTQSPVPPMVCSRYSPHQDADPLKPREPAIIKHFTAYKNQDHGAWLRGGDVWLDSCK